MMRRNFPSGGWNRTAAALALAGVALMAALPAQAATITYATRAGYQAALGTSVTDDYSNAGYAFSQTDAAMSAVLGETDYTSTGFLNTNLVFPVGGVDRAYCAGCNGSFRLTFTSTSVGTASGVYGVGFDYDNNPDFATRGGPAYVAFVTFGDDTTAEYSLSTAPFGLALQFFFGLTSDSLIKSVHLGLTGGGATGLGGFIVDDLTIGSAAAAVPEPGSVALLGLGLALAAASRRRRGG
ncbi:MAG: PEP-CTERM sorting domain-containing protein [Rubrivivax sp.]|nr:PEP-CTERM sorting domain-containing protein [Rubrivivax sp.]